MIDKIISELNKSFMDEARSSPLLLQDMAQMEKYVSESYSERILVELLQNSDDAGSKSVKMFENNNNLYFANDGRSFDENDIYSICRSGSSSKNKGDFIGYRGIGFKSACYLSTEIIIYSDGVYFTFSKSQSSKELNIREDQVPTVRIPFHLLINHVDSRVDETVKLLEKDGYNTVFIFLNSKVKQIEEEVKSIDSGYFLFLNHISIVDLRVGEEKRYFDISRADNGKFSNIDISGVKDEYWRIVRSESNDKISIAYKKNKEGNIIDCNESESHFHCYLPTLEGTGFPIKINGDFTTDPSRKHLILDSRTNREIEQSALLVFSIIKDIINNENMNVHSNGFINLLRQQNSFSKFSNLFYDLLKTEINAKSWMILQSGEVIMPENYKKSSWFLEKAEFDIIRKNSSYIQSLSLYNELYINCPDIDYFLDKYSTKEYEISDWIEILKDRNVLRNVNEYLLGKIYGNLVKAFRTDSIIHSYKIVNFEECLINTETEIMKLYDLNDKCNFSSEFTQGFSEVVTIQDTRWFDSENKTKLEMLFSNSLSKQRSIEQKKSFYSYRNNGSDIITKTPLLTQAIVAKWRSAEQNCCEFEKMIGNKAKDVSKQNLGYDIESYTQDGKRRYIEVKSISKEKESFSMTNNEYSAAHQYGKDYFLCLAIQNENEFNLIYIEDPINTLIMEKRVRQWEWICEFVVGEKFTLQSH